MAKIIKTKIAEEKVLVQRKELEKMSKKKKFPKAEKQEVEQDGKIIVIFL